MQVSVVIPIYNAEQFVAEAVASALAQDEVAEVLLIDDGSKDTSLEICDRLALNPRVRVLTHPGKINLGVSATRNLGILNASMPYIAFLDADDTWAPKRFDVAHSIFDAQADADGVHEMIAIDYHDPALRKRLQHIERGDDERIGIRIPTAPENLFRVLAMGKFGHIHLNGLVLKKSSLDGELLMDTTLKMSEDVDFILRLAATKRLYQGDMIRNVATRRVHGLNSVLVNPDVMRYRKLYLQKCIDQNFYGSRDTAGVLYVISRRVGLSKAFTPFRRWGKSALPIKLFLVGGYLLVRPGVLLKLMNRVVTLSAKRNDLKKQS